MKTVAVIGCGAWASTVTCLLAEKNSPSLNNTKIPVMLKASQGFIDYQLSYIKIL